MLFNSAESDQEEDASFVAGLIDEKNVSYRKEAEFDSIPKYNSNGSMIRIAITLKKIMQSSC